MAEFEAGVAFVSLAPSARGFQKKAKKELAGIDIDKSVDLNADASKVREAIAQVKQQLKALDREKANPSIDFDAAVATARIDEAKAKLEELGKLKPSPKVSVQTATAQRELNQLEKQLETINARKATVDVDADIAAGRAQLAEFEALLQKIDAANAQPKVTADTTRAKAELQQLDAMLAGLDTSRATPEVALQAAQAQQEALRIRADLERLGAMRPSPQVDADIASAAAKLAMVNQQLRGLNDKTVRVNASGNASVVLAAVIAALATIGAVAPAAVGALAAVGGAVGALGQGVAAGMAGFAGIGDALKALEADEKSAASSSAASSNARASAAKQVEAAQRALAQTQTMASRSAITGAQQVADAERALAAASVSASRARIQADQQVAAARRAVSDAVSSASQRVMSAERSLENAQRSRQYAQESLTEAVKDATRANRDLNQSVAGAALSEERAALSLEQARKRLAESTATDPLEKADLALSVREAEQNLKEVQTRYGDLKSDQAEWARSGVMGSKRVQSAARGVIDSTRGIEDAQRSVTEAQTSGARQISDAQEALARTQQTSAWAVQDAQRGVADSQLAVGRAAQQSAWQQEDAARQVADAQRALSDAYVGAGSSAAVAAGKAAQALADLTPAGRSMVKFLRDEWQPTWKRTSDAVADEMLPKVEQALRNLIKLEPTLTAGLADTGGVLGDLAVKGSELAASPAFQASLGNVMSSNNRALRDYGEAGISLANALVHLWEAAGPTVEEFAQLANASSEAFEQWVLGKQASGELQGYIQKAGDVLQYLSGWLVDVGGDVMTLASNLAPLGFALLEIVRSVTDFAARLSDVSPGLTSLAGGAVIAAVGLSKLGGALQTGGALSNFATGLNAVTGSMGNVPGKANPATGSVGRLGAAISGLSRIGVIGAAVAALAVTIDSLQVPADETAKKMLENAHSAREVQTEFNNSNKTLRAFVTAIPILGTYLSGLVDDQDDLNKSLQQQWIDAQNAKIAQDNLTAAYGLADQRLRDYQAAVNTFGENSPQAAAANGLYANAVRGVEDAQRAAGQATDGHTAALTRQRDGFLSSIDADIQWRAAVDATRDAVAQNGRTVDLNTASGRANMTQLQELSRAAFADIEAKKQQGASTLETTNLTDRHRQSLYDAAVQLGMTKDEARRYVDQLNFVPDEVTTKITTPGLDKALQGAQDLAAIMRDLDHNGRATAVGAVQGAYDAVDRATRNGKAQGGLVGYSRGGRVWGAGTATSDSIPAMLSNGEYVIRAAAVHAVGTGTLDRINAMAGGGRVGYAAGGKTTPGTAVASVPSPTGDASSAAAAAAATPMLAGTMAAAQSAAAGLAPQLAGVTAAQQALASAGVTPLAGSIVGTLLPALAGYGAAIGVQAPAANTALQQAQALTRTSTAVTAAQTALQAGQMAAATTGMSVAAQDQYARLRAGQGATQASTAQTAANTAANSLAMSGSVTGMSVVSQAQHSAYRQSQGQTVQANNALATNTQMATGRMSGDTSVMSAVVQSQLQNLRGAQGTTAAATTAFADSWRDQLARTRPDSGNPIKWVIDFPMRSIVEGWNNLDSQFALNKHVNPYVANYAVGGKVTGPGGPTDDKIPAMLSNGEFVVREAVASRVPHFLRALNSGQGEAMTAAGAGKRVDPMLRLASGGPVTDAIARAAQFAKSQSGKPYQWGGTGNPSWDCSGFVGGVVHALSGRDPFSGRIGTTSTMPWGGFIRGLSGSMTVGNAPGSHMAATLAGVNLESAGGGKGVHYGGPALGADNASFPQKFTLPSIGGRFISGGAGGGGGFDPTPMIEEAFAKAQRELVDVQRFFGSSAQVQRDQGVAAFALGKVKEHATQRLMEMFALSGGGGDVERWRGVVNQALGMVGQSPTLADTTLRRMNQESGGDPSAVNRWDVNWRNGTPSVGLMQVIGPTYRDNADPRHNTGPYLYGTSIDPLSNVLASMRYTMGRYGSLSAGYNRAGGYDNGGLLMPGRTLVENRTGVPERVLDNVETKSYDTLTRLVGKNGVNLTVDTGNGSGGKVFENLHVDARAASTPEQLARAVTWEMRRVRRGGVFNR